MARSKNEFRRWTPHEQSTLPFHVFQQHNAELEKVWVSHITATRFVYKKLGSSGASWTDLPSKHFDFSDADWYSFWRLRQSMDAFYLLDTLIDITDTLTLNSKH